jgi:hypothetical protein
MLTPAKIFKQKIKTETTVTVIVLTLAPLVKQHSVNFFAADTKEAKASTGTITVGYIYAKIFYKCKNSFTTLIGFIQGFIL